MSYTPEQLADLYTLAVSAETQEKRDDGYHDETFAMDEAVMAMAEQGYPELIRVLIDQLRAAGRRPDGETPDPGLVAEHAATMEAEGDMIAIPRGLLGTALGAINHPSHAAGMTIALLKAYACQRGHELTKPKHIDIKAEVERLPTCHMADSTGIIHGIRKDALYALLGLDKPEGLITPEPETGISWLGYQAIADKANVYEALTQLVEDSTNDNGVRLVKAIAEVLRPRPRFWIDMHGYSCHLLHSEADAIAHCNETGGLYVLPLFAGEPINTKLPMRMCRPAEEPQTVEVSALLRNLQAIPQKYTSDHVSLGEVFAVIEALRAKP